MLLLLCWCQLRHINHASINIATSVIGGRRWHGIWWISRSPTGYWRSLQLMRCVRWRSGWLLTNRGQMSSINEWIIPWGKHRYHRWRQLISLWVNVITIKAFVITRTVRLRPGWLLTNQGQLSWINEWIIPWGKRRYHRWRQLIALWANVIAIKAFFIKRTVTWRPGWLLTNRVQLRWIDDKFFQWKRNRYHR